LHALSKIHCKCLHYTILTAAEDPWHLESLFYKLHVIFILIYYLQVRSLYLQAQYSVALTETRYHAMSDLCCTFIQWWSSFHRWSTFDNRLGSLSLASVGTVGTWIFLHLFPLGLVFLKRTRRSNWHIFPPPYQISHPDQSKISVRIPSLTWRR
jgi:hypothetical protein